MGTGWGQEQTLWGPPGMFGEMDNYCPNAALYKTHCFCSKQTILIARDKYTDASDH